MSLKSLLKDTGLAMWRGLRETVTRPFKKKEEQHPNLLLDPSQNAKPHRPLRERLQDTYRMTIMNPETFEEVGTYNLSLMSVYTLFSSIFVGVTLIVISLLAFTPLKSYLPGYGDSKNYFQLMDKIDDLEGQVEANQTYMDYFRKMLIEDVKTKKETPKEAVSQIPDSLLDIPTVEEERQLREQYERNNGVASIINGTNNSNQKTASTNMREVALEQIYFTPPIDGQIIRGLKPKESHFGIDLVAPKNTPIKAALDGYVVSADYTVETGNSIVLQHQHGVMTTYKHCSSLLKKQGAFVRAGEAIAIIGNTGTLTSGPHLHFELWQNGKCVDPTEYITFK
ncbi:MAG: M23 family metallopeptidase [Saprospiraceae bacterium]